jgi:predicted nucleotidyltransferase
MVKQNPYLTELKQQVLGMLKGQKIKVILFGSRARTDYVPSSDVDIGLIPYGTIDESKITLLRDRVERLNIPYKVEIVNFQDVSDNFKAEALKEAIVWKD